MAELLISIFIGLLVLMLIQKPLVALLFFGIVAVLIGGTILGLWFLCEREDKKRGLKK